MTVIICETCNGSGEETCHFCSGNGAISGETCPLCEGSAKETCSSCWGAGEDDLPDQYMDDHLPRPHRHDEWA